MKNSVKEVKVGLNFGDKIMPVGRLVINNRQIYVPKIIAGFILFICD